MAITKVDGLGFGQTFTSPGKKAASVPMPPLPNPMVAVAVTPKTRADEQKIGEALHKLPLLGTLATQRAAAAAARDAGPDLSLLDKDGTFGFDALR